MNSLKEKITITNYIASLVFVCAVLACMLLCNRERSRIVVDEASEYLFVVQAPEGNKLTVQHSLGRAGDALILSALYREKDEKVTLLKKDYAYSASFIDLRGYDLFRLRIKSDIRDAEQVTLGFRTQKYSGTFWNNSIDNVGILWSKLVTLKNNKQFYTFDIPFSDFSASAEDHINQQLYRSIIGSDFSYDTAIENGIIKLQEILLYPDNTVIGHRRFEIDYIKLIKSAPFTGGTVASTLIILLLVLLLACIAYDYRKAMRIKAGLYSQIQSSNKQLVKINSELQSLEHAKTEFFTNITHELRTPLTIIHTTVEGILNGSLPNTDQMISALYKNSSKLLAHITALLDLSKIDENRLALDKKIVDISPVITDLISSFMLLAKQKQITVQSSVSENLWVLADSEYLERAFSNVIGNAFKFTQQAGKISINAIRDEGYISVSVQDSGIGIPEDKMESIFDRFSQVKSGSVRSYEGAGIGLAFAKEIVERHSGTVTVTSEVGKGSCFGIVIPYTEPAHISKYDQKKHMSHHHGRSKIDTSADIQACNIKNKIIIPSASSDNCISDDETKHRVLIIEDNEDMRYMLSNVLSPMYDIFMVNNGKEALHALYDENCSPDLIVTDLIMPVMDGFSFIANLRNDTEYAGIPIIILSAKSAIEDHIKGFDCGAIDYIVKPFHTIELQRRIEAQLSLKRIRDSLWRSNKLLYDKLHSAVHREVQLTDITKDKIEKVAEFIQNNFTADLSREGLAAAVDMSPDHLSRSFNKHTGKSIPAYINDLRIDKAAELLLQSAYSITRIAHDVGFDTVRSFNYYFRQRFAMTPSQYRSGRL